MNSRFSWENPIERVFQRTVENFSAGKRLSDTEKAEVQRNTCGTKKGLRDRQRKG
jgi:hypothetical protein